MVGDTAWKMGDAWVLLTDRSPREMGASVKAPMAVYYALAGPRRFQYVLPRRPRASPDRNLTFLRDE